MKRAIIQQSAPSGGVAENSSAKDDAALQEAAEKILNDPDMGSVSITVTSARAALTGTANSESTKERAERLVKSVRGVKSVDNKIYVAGE
ncbi:MAG TPA: BON domain-containing protein [Pyrinomonadaceae bacterium]|nr:BON domain-containing protein [Pyrinomonadaceae bacterium]